MKIVIVGGVAAGAGAAARLRRLDESAEIVLLEKGSFISYANCGLPYHLGEVIPEREDLLVMTPEKFKAWLNIDTRIQSEVIRIDPAAQTITVRHDGREYTETYDKLLLATGACPVEQAVPGADDPRVMHLWTLADMDRVMKSLRTGTRRAVVVGAGFIGLEVAENLRARGLDVMVVQRSNHVLPSVDFEMAAPLAAELAAAGIELQTGRNVVAYEQNPHSLTVVLDNGTHIETDLAVVAIGVRPNSQLAQSAGLQCGAHGHIVVDEHLRTSDPNIFAAGDAVEVMDPVFGGKTAIPLAGPANKQGRIAADNIAGKKTCYRGTFGASVVKVGRLTAASVGMTEKRLRELKKEYRKIYLHPSSSASYYPGASRMDLKLIFGDDGTIYGAQIIGAKGVDKRIDSIAQAMRNHLQAQELGELELAYAPPYSSAKDPVNFAGFVAENVLSGISDVVYPDSIPDDAVILDVREAEEYALGSIPGAINIPLGTLRSRLAELDRTKLIVTFCQVGLRGYLAERILKQHGFRAADLSGGWLTWQMYHPAPPSVCKNVIPPRPTAGNTPTLDVRSLPCPGPVMKLKAQIDQLSVGSSLHVLAASAFEGDLVRWAETSGNTLANLVRQAEWLEADVIKGAAASPTACSLALHQEYSAAIVLFSNDLDKALAALILANGLAASGAKVGIFFTFWGLSVLRKDPAPAVKKNFISRMFGALLPTGPEKLALSKMNMLGMGTAMMKNVMRQQQVVSLPELLRSAKASGVQFIACDMAMSIMGITREELIDVDEVAGVAAFAELAKRSSTTLFI